MSLPLKPGMALHQMWAAYGYLDASHVPKPERRKLDLKARKCILLGYSEHQKGYRLYDLGREKVFSIVVFNEASVPGIEKEQKGSGEKYMELEIEEPVAEDPAAPELDAVDPEPEIEEPVVEDAVIPNPTARDEADEMDDQTAEERRSEELQRKVPTTSDPPVRRSTRVRRSETLVDLRTGGSEVVGTFL